MLVLGAGGQLGSELTRALASVGNVTGLDRSGLDLSDLDAVRATVQSAGADVIVNAAAYTQVDRAEKERDVAYRVNGEAPAVLASHAARTGALLVHFSTDYVFDGLSRRPYTEEDAPAPLNAYGATKLAGDHAVLASDAEVFVFRVGWVYSRRGQSFLRRIEQLAVERDELRVVADQYGSPSYARSIAEHTTLAIGEWLASRHDGRRTPPRGLYHMASPDYATWHEFAKEIVHRMEFPRMKRPPAVTPITTEEFRSPVRRPVWSVLNSEKLACTFGTSLPPWKEQLAMCLARV